MIKNKRNTSSSETLAWLRNINAKLKREKRQRAIEELDRLADIELAEINNEIDRIKNEFLDKTPEKMLTC